jgi:hypothetical protein
MDTRDSAADGSGIGVQGRGLTAPAGASTPLEMPLVTPLDANDRTSLALRGGPPFERGYTHVKVARSARGDSSDAANAVNFRVIDTR